MTASRSYRALENPRPFIDHRTIRRVASGFGEAIEVDRTFDAVGC